MKLSLALCLLVVLQVGVMSIKHTTSEKKWELLLKTIGAKELEVIKVIDDKIIVKVDRANLKHLRNLLDSKDVLQKNTLHALFCDKPRSVKGAYSNVAIDVKAKDWFRRVVSDEFIRQYKLSQVFDAMQSHVQFDEDLSTMTLQFSLPDITSYQILRLGLAKLQSAVSDEKTLAKILAGEEPTITSHNNESPSKFAQLVSKIIFHEDPYTINFIINNGAFAQALQAHIVNGEAPIIASNLKGLFIIDKQYLMKYLTPIFNGLVWSEEEKIPIVFSAKRPETETGEIKKNSHDINMLIDTSGSMGSNFNTYINNIKDILDKLDDVPNWQIQIVRFSTNSSGKFFSFKNGDSIRDVKKYIESFVASGITRLYCTVKESLQDIREKFTNTIDLYSTLMVFTDGDNNAGCTEDDVINAASYLKVIPQFNMYGIGFGASESGYQAFFKRLAKEGGFVHIKLDDPDGMSQLQQYISILTQKINVWEILQGELGLSVSRVPEGDVFILDPGTQSGSMEITFMKNNQKIKLGTEDVNCV